MIRWIIILMVVALVAATLGFDGVAGATAANVRLLYFMFIIVTGVSLIRRSLKRPKERNF